MKDITFITTSDGKWKTAHDVLKNYNVNLHRMNFETPEIQSLHVQEVAEFSAQYVANKVNKPIMLTDIGYYIDALNGYPGPLIKYMNMTLKSKDILDLMANHKDNRKLTIKECLSYCEPGKDPVSFISERTAKIIFEEIGNKSSIDNILILDGLETTTGSTPKKVLEQHWLEHLTHYYDFGDYIKKASS